MAALTAEHPWRTGPTRHSDVAFPPSPSPVEAGGAGTCEYLRDLDTAIRRTEEAMHRQREALDALRRLRVAAGRACGPAGRPVPPAEHAPARPDDHPVSATPRRPADRLRCLTGTERQILSLVASGLTNRSVARRLGVSERTVRNHLHAVFTKLHVDNRTAATVVGLREGLVPGTAASETV